MATKATGELMRGTQVQAPDGTIRTVDDCDGTMIWFTDGSIQQVVPEMTWTVVGESD